ncbi:hypothetical protein N7533_007672 [Penicillium manginii]|uniref:uncharacterized protein n=1 Tax=Penicillium manginii TaxID=203109 RepID=UPI0025494575|nr:uncharacterized protein N7533_007672 [Penicillium manginii]KAJ5750644.1 hypothetical protein N7533_007672 [Penicillium manginii]
MLIKVRTLTGKEIELDIEPDYKVARIKERVEEKEGIPPSPTTTHLRRKANGRRQDSIRIQPNRRRNFAPCSRPARWPVNLEP